MGQMPKLEFGVNIMQGIEISQGLTFLCVRCSLIWYFCL